MTPVFFVNPLSERVAKKGSVLAALTKEIGATLYDLRDFSHLSDAVAASVTADRIVIEGGDGTVHGVLSAFLSQLDDVAKAPDFMIVPGGMTNQVASQIGLKSSKKQDVKAAILSPTCKTESYPLVHVTDATGATYSGFLFSTGALPQMTKYTTGKIHTKGIGGSAAVLGGILKALRGQDSEIMSASPISFQADEHSFSGAHLGSIITTLPAAPDMGGRQLSAFGTKYRQPLARTKTRPHCGWLSQRQCGRDYLHL